MKYKISLLLFLFTLIPQLNLLAASSVKCKKLEKTRLGCVPSQDHICGLPKGLNEYGKQQCAFVDNFSKTYKLAPGIFPFECLSKNCVDERVCTSEGCQIVTTCTCSKYADPICTFTCTGFLKNYLQKHTVAFRIHLILWGVRKYDLERERILSESFLVFCTLR
jgi:hypothetical protein